jgi:hypothetical protein
MAIVRRLGIRGRVSRNLWSGDASAIIVTPSGQALVSRHKKLKPALAAVVRATELKPTNPKRKKVRR